jgi:hypothetical protein
MPAVGLGPLTKSSELGILAMLMECITDRHSDVAHGVGRRNLYRIAGRGLLIVVVIALAGCVSDAASGSFDTQPPVAATVEPADHQLRIVAVDFDPPLDYAQIVSNNGVTLMAAVENQGLSDEANVQVTARLLDPSAAPEASDIMDQTVVLTHLAPGQIRVARFSQANGLPLLARYRLEVAVEPVSGEQQTSDNYRIYEIAVPDGE